MRRALSVLEDLQIASPCSESWERMRGDDRERHCDKCELQVFNLSEMTSDAALALLRERAGVGERMCVRLYKRADGTVITQDCPVGLARVRRRIARLGAIVAGLLFAAIGFGMHGRGESAELESSSPGSRVAQWVNGSWRAATPTPVPPQMPYAVQGGIAPMPWHPVATPAPTKAPHVKKTKTTTSPKKAGTP